MTLPFPNPLAIERLIDGALDEDLGRAGDITTRACVPEGAVARATIGARDAGTIAGLDVASAVFRRLDPSVTVTLDAADGDRVAPGAVLARVEGNAWSVLAAERVALNLLGHLSGIATATRSYADKIVHTRAKVACTRKTTPGLRALEKYAVRCGGGANHRFGLDDAMLIKDNHVAMAGGVGAALDRARAHAGHLVKIELEVDTLDQLAEALDHGVDAVLLDNMDPPTLRRAVAMVAGRAITEASGRITPEMAREVAEAGVDLISMGWLTHSVAVLDIGLDHAG
jgi:nicotinate-nucleotide pyrophosphorylase (carboxylating)